MKPWRWLIGALAYLLVVLPASAQEAAGDWEGVLKLPNGQLHIVIHLRKEAGDRYAGTMDSPDQGVTGIPVGTVTADGKALAFDVPSVAGAYRGIWDGNRWTGQWAQGGGRFPLDLARADAAAAATESLAGLDGDWDGTLDAPPTKLRLVFHIRITEMGTAATMDSVDQGGASSPVSSIRRKGTTVRIELRGIKALFEGALDAGGQTITGTWTQGGSSLPLSITRRAKGASGPTMRRPQMPVRPFPYREEDVAFDNPKAKVRLAGTLTLPRGDGPFPAVILIAGSGPLDRDESLFGHKPFLVIADHLTRRGIAVLRFDKRGIGKSTGNFGKATSADFATDVEAGLTFLKSRPEISKQKIGLIGHSEGGMIAPMVATRDPSVAFVVLLAAPGLPGVAFTAVQGVDLNRTADWSAEQAEQYGALLRKAFAAIVAAPNSQEAAARARAIMQDARAMLGLSEDDMTMVIERMTSDWFRFFLAYDPTPALQALTCPVLAINGSRDIQVASGQNLAAIRKALAGNRDVEIRELPGLNHLFQTAGTGRMEEYGTIEETFAPAALELISAWIAAHVK